MDCCPYETTHIGHRCSQREDCVRTRGENGHPQAKERGHRRNQHCWHFGLGFLAYSLWENKCFLFKLPSQWGLFYSLSSLKHFVSMYLSDMQSHLRVVCLVFLSPLQPLLAPVWPSNFGQHCWDENFYLSFLCCCKNSKYQHFRDKTDARCLVYNNNNVGITRKVHSSMEQFISMQPWALLGPYSPTLWNLLFMRRKLADHKLTQLQYL